MTNHSETTGPAANGNDRGHNSDGRNGNGRNSTGRNGDGRSGIGRKGNGRDSDGPGIGDRVGFDAHGAAHQVTLRTPGELADALPYLLGYRPEDSIVLVALHDRGGRGRFGGRARLGIPANKDDWPAVARQLAHGLITGSERRGARPEQMVAYLCQEPGAGETGRQITERLAPLAGLLRTECGRLDVPVIEALCISDGRYWSYCCPSENCCPAQGLPMGLPGTSVLAAAATYAGLQVRGTLRELRARLQPWETAAALEQEVALDTAGMALVPRMLDQASRVDVAERTLRLARSTMARFAEAAPVSGPLQADLRDDELLGHEDAAELILGLQDRTTRDRAAEWMEAEEAGPALRLWRALARRCVGPYGEHAAAPLTLAGWVAWSAGDEIEAREALAMALGADPSYLFARLLHQACNEGLDPESIRRCLRAEREGRDARARSEAAQSADAEPNEDMTALAEPTEDVTALAEPTENMTELNVSGDDGSQPSSPPTGDGTMDLPGVPADALAVSPSHTEGTLPPCPSGADRNPPTPAPTASRRRKRVRPGARADALPRPVESVGRQPRVEESRPRSRPARGTRPGTVRRTAGKADAHGPESTRPEGEATEEKR
ncbi:MULTISPECIES: DUF4192 domain-containing protein [Streptomyces]|uniref:DUF4192 domain-containing protein n=1 Tax=Streptomyces pseudovenezuelae TaxID=67350 RepID=A0A101N3F5_9ACTN|nr:MULTISPECIES: DUF4192 domain-containing protein [Streptomyces]KUM85825.1 hypothetical protein AQI94_24755 [Streptomyces pseudovenezuelae]